jgi:DNA repair photolyase
MNSPPLKGRGTVINPTPRFAALARVADVDWSDVPEADRPAPRTEIYRDASRTVITRNDSPDIPFSVSLNPYRGCEHGCAYCYARPYHEYLGLSAGLDFETKIIAKPDAPQRLRAELASRRWTPQTLALSGVTDPYQPVERKLRITRRCLEVLAECRHPVAIVTKNHLVTRDIPLLSELARHRAASVYLSITTLDAELARRLEPRTAAPAARLRAVAELSQAGILVGVLIAPVIPGLTDHELPAILRAAAQAGATFAGMAPVRLPGAVQELFVQWLADHCPDRRAKVLQQIRALRGGRLNDTVFGRRMTGEGLLADQLGQLFAVACRRAGLQHGGPALSSAAFRRPAGPQGELWPTAVPPT